MGGAGHFRIGLHTDIDEYYIDFPWGDHLWKFLRNKYYLKNCYTVKIEYQ